MPLDLLKLQSSLSEGVKKTFKSYLICKLVKKEKSLRKYKYDHFTFGPKLSHTDPKDVALSQTFVCKTHNFLVRFSFGQQLPQS